MVALIEDFFHLWLENFRYLLVHLVDFFNTREYVLPVHWLVVFLKTFLHLLLLTHFDWFIIDQDLIDAGDVVKILSV